MSSRRRRSAILIDVRCMRRRRGGRWICGKEEHVDDDIEEVDDDGGAAAAAAASPAEHGAGLELHLVSSLGSGLRACFEEAEKRLVLEWYCSGLGSDMPLASSRVPAAELSGEVVVEVITLATKSGCRFRTS
jgi:hypothetical protein